MNIAASHIIASQVKQKVRYDRKHAKPGLFQKGLLVLKKDFRWKKWKGGKINARFLRLCIIEREMQRGIDEIITKYGMSTVCAKGAHLNLYNKPLLSPK